MKTRINATERDISSVHALFLRYTQSSTSKIASIQMEEFISIHSNLIVCMNKYGKNIEDLI